MLNKKFVIGVFLLLFSCTEIEAQFSVSDSTDRNENFSNKSQIDLTGLSTIYSGLKKSTIVILNKKEIISIDSKKFRDITNDMIFSLDIIEDKRSITEIKTILFIQTK